MINLSYLLAQQDLGQIGGPTGFGPWGDIAKKGADVGTAAGIFTNVLSRVIGVMTIVAGLWFMFQLIIGGYSYMSAGSDPKKMGDATAKITNSLIGLVVIVTAYAIISLLGELLGFKFLNLEPLIEKLGPK